MATYQAQVLYDYTAQDDDQLSIKPGEIVSIIDSSQDLNGWALAQKGDKEGYVPAEYVRSVDDSSAHQPYMSSEWNNASDEWQPSGFKTFYETVLSQEHRLPFSYKLPKAVKDVLVPCPCRQLDYVMSRPESRKGAILTLLFGFVICSFDGFSILSPILPFGSDSGVSVAQLIVCLANFFVRALLTLLFIKRYPRPNLNFTTFPLLNIVSSLTFSIRIYELLEMGDNKEYDGYRYYRSWMWSSFTNLPFAVVALVLVIVDSSVGSIALSVLVLVGNLLNVGRCFLASWARKESGNDIHPDFEQTIKRCKL